MRPKGSPEELERRQLYAIALLHQEYQPVEVAGIVGIDRRSVRRWNRTSKSRGTAPDTRRCAEGQNDRHASDGESF